MRIFRFFSITIIRAECKHNEGLFMTLIFDFDSTLLSCEGLDLIAELKGISLDVVHKLEEITSEGMNGEISLEESISKRLKLMEFSRSDIQSFLPVFKEKISTSVLRNLSFFEQNKDSIYVISGGFRDFVVPISEFVGFHSDHIFANTFIYEGDSIKGLDSKSLLYRNGDKPKLVKSQNMISPIVMIGDGATDYEVKADGVADYFIAYTENISRETVVQNANFVAECMEDVIEFLDRIR